MRSITKRKNKKPYLIVALVIVLLLIAGGLYMWLAQPFHKAQPTSSPIRPVNSIDYGPPTQQDKQDVDTHKQDLGNQQQNPPAQPSGATVIIARASQAGSGQPLNIRTTISGATSGTCSATLTMSGQSSVTGSGTITFNATTYSCNIDIPASSFGANGQWQLSVTSTSGGATSKAATQTVAITK